jgi:hypothetical protein
MKTNCKLALVVAVAGLGVAALNTGCVYEGPPSVAVETGFMVDDCFWDGFEYVGWYGDHYYYWGPNQAWIICDPVRVGRVNVWVQTHPDWRTHVTPVAPARANQAPAEHSAPAHMPPAHRYYHDRDRDRN